MAKVNGTLVDDTLYGTPEDDQISGRQGNDVLKGFGGADQLDGGPGNDTVIYGDSTVSITVNLATGRGYRGTAAGDTLFNIENVYGSAQGDFLYGNGDANRLYGLSGNDVLRGEAGIDRLDGADGNDSLTGGPGPDTLIGDTGNDTAFYFDSPVGVRILLADNVAAFGDATGDQFVGVENIFGSDHEDLIAGDEGANGLSGWDGDDELWGMGGDDFLDGASGTDVMFGGRGNDTFYVDTAGDMTFESAGQGTDRVLLELIDYTLTEGSDIEILSVGNSRDDTPNVLIGNSSANQIIANDGNNTLNGRDGRDELNGFGGRDSFVFDTTLDAAVNVDTIVDFEVGQDTIVLENTIFGAFAAGDLAAERFVVGTAAQDESDNIIYDINTGSLFYDNDGNGAGAAPVRFATVTAGLALTHLDFIVV